MRKNNWCPTPELTLYDVERDLCTFFDIMETGMMDVFETDPNGVRFWLNRKLANGTLNLENPNTRKIANEFHKIVADYDRETRGRDRAQQAQTEINKER